MSTMVTELCRTTSLRDAPRSLSSAGVRGSKLRAASRREVRATPTPNSYFDSATPKGVGDFLVRMSLSGKLKKYLN
ncbi:MAG: hypothetical protein V7K15_05785 [Nostoc sp.]